MFQISLSVEKKAVSALSVLAAMGAAGMASQANAATIDVGKPTTAAWQWYNTDYPSWGIFGSSDWLNDSNWYGVRHPGSGGRTQTGYLNWTYDFATSDPIVSATLTIEGYGSDNVTYGFNNGSHIIVGSLTSAWNQGAASNPVSATVETAAPIDSGATVSISIDITSLAQAWKADPGSFHGVSFWSPDSPAGVMSMETGNDIWGNNGRLTLVTASTPEPAAVGLMTSASGVLLLRRRRK